MAPPHHVSKRPDPYEAFARRSRDKSPTSEYSESTVSGSSTSSRRRADRARRRAEINAQYELQNAELEQKKLQIRRELELSQVDAEESEEEELRSRTSSRRSSASKESRRLIRKKSSPAVVFASTPIAPEEHKRKSEPTRPRLDPEAPSFSPSATALGCTIAPEMLLSFQQSVNASMVHAKLSKMPPVKLPVFTGEITEFSAFRRSFVFNIENNVEDPATRLSQLQAHVEKAPAELIACCEHMEPASGYNHAWDLLLKKYGKEYELAESYVAKLLAWKVIKEGDVVELERYGNYLNRVAAALQPNYSRLEGMDTMCAVASKLPLHLQRTWGKRLGKAQAVSFPDFVDFVMTEVEGAEWCRRIASAGKSHLTSTSKARSPEVPLKSLTLAATNPISASKVLGDEKNCSCCHLAPHALHKCPRFGKMPKEERWKYVIAKKLCYRCLQYGHVHGEYCPMTSLQCSTCGASSHNSLLHCDLRERRPFSWGGYRSKKPEKAPEGGTEPEKLPEDGKDSKKTSVDGGPSVRTAAESGDKAVSHTLPVSSLSDHRPDGRVMLKIVPARVNGQFDTYAFLDSGASACLASKSLMDRLGVVGRPVTQTMKTENGEFQCHELASLTVSNVEGGESELLDEVYVTGDLSITKNHMMPVEWVTKWPHLQDLRLPANPTGTHKVELLIGLNTPICRKVLDQRHGDKMEPSAYLTSLGWVVFGPTGERKAEALHLHHVRPEEEVMEVLQQQCRRDFWEKEAYCKKENSIEDHTFLQKVSETIEFTDGKYQVSLPFRGTEPVILPDNLCMAEHRMKSLKRKLDRDPKMKTDYVASIEGSLAKGHAEVVPEAELLRSDGKVWRVPHHGVRHPTKDKHRVVFDLKATYMGTSPNEHLLQGPDLTNSLLGTLLRFRLGEHAVTADIKEMFMQVRVPRAERDYFRFLWWMNGDTSKPLYECRMLSHPFGARSSPGCVNFALKKTAEDHGEKYGQAAAQVIQRNFYVDNLLKAMDDEAECIDLVKNVRLLCEAGGWRLNQWTSNNKRILASIPASEIDASIAPLDLNKDELPSERALGTFWSMEEDSFFFKLSLKQKPITRRGLLSTVYGIYDILGLISPIIVTAKMLLQSLCKSKVGWDAPIGDEMSAQWSAWLEGLSRLEEFKIRRNIAPKSFGKIVSWQLHHFADASQFGYGTATYLRVVNEHGEVHCVLIMSRARVAPLKGSTIPRLELTAALIIAQLDHKLREELDLDLLPSVFWTDSTTVLKYLHNERARYHTFVANRVGLIRELTSVEAWRYVDTASNPADYASRGMKVEEFLACEMWTSGPGFLLLDEEHWPTMPVDVKIASLDGDVEVRREPLHCEVLADVPTAFDVIVESTSSWQRLVRTVGWLRRFVAWLRHRVASKKGLTGTSCAVGPLTVAETRDSAEVIWKIEQIKYFQAEVVSLSKGRQVRRTSPLLRLQPVLKDGLLRVGGRLSRSELEAEAKNPIILPSKSTAVRLMATSIHEAFAHAGQNFVVAVLRHKYWIVHSNRLVRSITRNCVKCKKIAAKPMTQIMADLPQERMTAGRPFECTGTDCFGPFQVRIGRSTVKRWGAVFTCMASRAVHIEVLSTMETDSFVNALRRFLSRRGHVRKIFSDNGTNLVGTEKLLKDELKKLNATAITREMETRGVEWHFNPPHASHFGGAWERQIRSIRRVLNGLGLVQVMSDETLCTLMCEAEAVLNARPLTRVMDDPEEVRPLTPGMLLTQDGAPGPVTVTDRLDLYAKARWRQVQYLADLFWKRWSREYLSNLQARQKWTIERHNLKEGDIVLLLDEKSDRGTWPMGRVTAVITSEDGHVRQARVKTLTGEYTRPISKMCRILEGESVT